tara:strand:+ start:2753 stop:3214 length:462 start_codon:yes stop_codon:yes gene_type:complete
MNNIIVRVIDCHIVFMNDSKFEFLMLKRSDNKIYPRIWQGVTGKIKKYEVPKHAAIRELKEETGLKPENLWTVDTVNYFYDAKNNTMNLIPVFGVQVLSKNVVLSNEHSEYKWCNFNDAINLLTWEQQKKGLQVFNDMLKKNDKRIKILKLEL